MNGERLHTITAAGMLLVVIVACKAPRDGEFKAQEGAEPAGTCAIEGYLRGDAPASPASIVVVLTWKSDAPGDSGGGLYKTTATDGRFRVGALPCTTPRVFDLSVMTDAHQGGTVHTTMAGNSDFLSAHSGMRLTNVRVDLVKGWSFHGSVKDAAGAPVEGVEVRASYKSSGGTYAWSPPQEFSRSDASGAWTLDGVVASRFADASHPMIGFYKKGYRALEQPVASGGTSSSVDVVLASE